MKSSKAAKAERIFKRVLREIKPSASETNATIASINAVMHRLKGIVDKGVELRVVGSIARGTNLKGDSDVDIFVLFERGTDRESLVKKGLEYGKALASGKRDRYEIKYAEHPYIRLYLDRLDVRIDLVPALKIESIEQMATTVDRTPLHADFVNANLTEKQRNEARVLKQLLKVHSIYGAEVKVGGFPGYLCEILIYQFGSLLRLLESASAFRLPLVLDPKTKSELKDQNILKKFSSEFVVIDPVDPGRNVAAGVSMESLARFVLIARGFTGNPGIRYFYGHGFSSASASGAAVKFIRESGFSTYLLSTEVSDKSEDIVWPQLRKIANILSENASRYGYNVALAIPWVSGRKGYILFILPDAKVGARMLRGPDVFMREAAENFLKAHKERLGTIIRGSTVYIIERNRYQSMEAFLRDSIRNGSTGKHNDINLRRSSIIANKIPRALAEEACAEILKRIML
ncbi:MAG: CCA tRNA nucleotidyltransferase [Candidatus Micrarchaeaceae archaeon]